ncbi:MAG: transketolase family protein [Oscillospiraceae bacterium]
MKIVYNGEADKRTFKDVYVEVFPKIAEADSDFIYLDADLMNCIGTSKFSCANPGRGINCGISEANMVGVACGLAAVGYKPVCHSFGTFSSRRVFDQAFLSGAYAGNAVTIIGSDPGVCAAYNGGTHMPFEDMALYRSVPEATVLDIADTAQFEDVLWQVKDIPGVKYIRVSRKNCAKIYDDGSKFEIGKGIALREGKDVVIFASGIMVAKALAAADKLSSEGVNAAVVDLFTVKPIDEDIVVKYAKATGAVVTAENHNKIGGLTSAVSEVLAAKCPTPLEYVAVEDVFGEVGAQGYLEERFALTADHIIQQAKKVISRK